MRTFATDDEDTAKRFVAGEDIPEPEFEPSVVRLGSNRPDLIVFEIRDKVRSGDADAMFGFLTDALRAQLQVSAGGLVAREW